ncbi:MAG: glycosyltransferase involved in cell wall biosynthesis [Urechidicola sp.]|jgi:glycosyltransferase involved in cell wall biosynthesis|tara:strand:+ start:982 stop:2016 length:1035 start_codon:yes stop_codon:yes gene_type:complete
MNKKLILIGSGGKSVHIKNYYYLIKDYFDEVLVITDTEVDFCKFKKIGFSLRDPLETFKNTRKLRKIMKEFSPSVIHVHQANSYAFITSKANRGKFPQVLTTWGSDVLILPQQSKLLKRVVIHSLKKSDYITADASFMATAINKLAKKEVLIANFGIEMDQVSIPTKQNAVYSNRLHNPLYRIDKIIEGFAEFHKNNQDWKLIIGANGSETEKLKKQAKNLLPNNSYEFIGFVNQEENKKRYLESKIWISNPESDGTAISLLEAMGYGCIPVVADLPASKEWIENEKNGIVIGQNIAESLEKANNLVLETVQDLNKRIIETRATKGVNKEKFISLYNKILKLND